MTLITNEITIGLGILIPALLVSYQFFFGPLHDINGPILARFSRFWYFFSIINGSHEKEAMALHRKYGKVVRIAPNQYSIDDPEAVKTIYGYGTQFAKADWYKAFHQANLPTIFSGKNIKAHARDRKRLQKHYQMSVMTSYESYVDDCITTLSKRFREMAKDGRSIDLARWLQYFAFDVIGQVTYSRRFGFLDRGQDVDKLIESVQARGRTSAIIGVFHEIYPAYVAITAFLAKLGLFPESSQAYILDWTLKGWHSRKAELAKKKEEGADFTSSDAEDMPKDFLTKFIEANERDPEEFLLYDALNGVGGNVNAGSDTTSITLSTVFYHLCCNADVLHKLRAEIAEHLEAGTASYPITFKESQNMEYLQAVIKEALRINPAVGLPLLREVPASGAMLCDRYFPAGSAVGINPWIAHYNTDVFGEDAASFRPERWLKSCNDPDTLSRMEHYYLAFGAGSRVCLGRNVSMLEISKLVPEIVRRFDFEMSEDVMKNGVKRRNEFFVIPTNIFARVHEREDLLLE